jgi:phosphotriesterase-related protein
MPSVNTALGSLPASQLGVVMTHEHVFFRLDSTFKQADDDPDGHMGAALVEPRLQWWLRGHPSNNRDNLVQDDVDVAVSEVMNLKIAGGDALVDLGSVGVLPEPQPLLLSEVSRRTGVHIITGTGYYVGPTHPPFVDTLSVDALADAMRRDLTQGIANSNIRAGIIGELGLSTPPMPVELRVLAAAGKVQRELGYPINIHPVWGRDGAFLTARLADDAGVDPTRTVLSHLDNRFRDDVSGFRELGRRGFVLGLDCFGKECYWPHVNVQLPPDAERIRAVLGLLEGGFEKQILLSQDISTKHQLTRNGGQGYGYLLQCIRPRLLRSGVDEATLRRILVDNPRALLSVPGQGHPDGGLSGSRR